MTRWFIFWRIKENTLSNSLSGGPPKRAFHTVEVNANPPSELEVTRKLAFPNGHVEDGLSLFFIKNGGEALPLELRGL